MWYLFVSISDLCILSTYHFRLYKYLDIFPYNYHLFDTFEKPPAFIVNIQTLNSVLRYNPFLVYCRELALGTVSLTGDRAQGDDNQHDSHYIFKCPV